MRRLPFLRRNLRSGFQLHCRMVGVDTKPYSLPRTPISVVYTFPLTDGATAHSGGFRTTSAKSSMKNWLCPLCDLHNKFDNPRMLEKHLAWDHSSVKVLWDESRRQTLQINKWTSLMRQCSNPVITRRQAPIRDLSISEFSPDSRHVGRSMKSTEADEKSLVRISSTPSGLASESGSGSVSTIPTTVEEDLKPKYVMPGTSSHAVANPSIRKATVYYSCRPGGPRLFDFLNTLSLKPYGVLKWVIIDREEELFELDDILDEDKVMQALWFRWIFLNRNKFVANYFDGTKVFINQNWRLIKQGAGLLALRTWLLVLLVNNFLLPTEVATLMRYYQELANIQLRY
ncbi:hypothetical protein J3R82DRAFT_6627 [Butyriboletus roseoflavus]|nr:hypothetical protein J3R82DRAFT_6627 [Butyriboletus roseoflavus]